MGRMQGRQQMLAGTRMRQCAAGSPVQSGHRTVCDETHAGTSSVSCRWGLLAWLQGSSHPFTRTNGCLAGGGYLRGGYLQVGVTCRWVCLAGGCVLRGGYLQVGVSCRGGYLQGGGTCVGVACRGGYLRGCKGQGSKPYGSSRWCVLPLPSWWIYSVLCYAVLCRCPSASAGDWSAMQTAQGVSAHRRSTGAALDAAGRPHLHWLLN
jgi:hypothetical protein